MVIHTIIQERRKALGFTQEQLAEYLGVTAPAVNKWEKGSTCPDISLLPPLARLLKTDLNTLFGFYQDITKQELVRICKDIQEKTFTEGMEAGFSAARQILREYPNSEQLLHQITLQMQGLMVAAEVDAKQTEGYQKQINEWYARLAESEDAAIRGSACFMLANQAIGEEQYESAQAYLDRIPSRNDTPDKRVLQTVIHFKQNRVKEAGEILEQMLLTSLNEIQMTLFRLIDVNLAMGDADTAAYAAERAVKLAECFDLNPYNKAVAPFLIAVGQKNVEQALPLIKAMFSAMSVVWTPQASPLYQHIPTPFAGVSMERMRGLLLQALRQEPDYAFLRERCEFQELLAELEAT